jgi:hypothetical protein
VADFLAQERQLGYADGRALRDFSDDVEALRRSLREAITQIRSDGRTIAAYGATAKGNTLLTTCGIARSDVMYIVDRNPLKQGLLAPGTLIPVVGPAELERRPPEVLLLLAWNIKDEVIAQESAFAANGGTFFIPIPAPRFV